MELDNGAPIVPKQREMTLLIKICGLSTEATIDAAVGAGADMIGLVIHPASPRNVTIERAVELRRHAGDRAEIVTLTVDSGDSELDEIVRTIEPDRLQLHGRESPEQVSVIRKRYGLPVLKAIPVRDAADIDDAARFRGVADMILFDAKAPPGAPLPGGNGIAFDWRLLKDVAAPFMLSGGLNPGNVGEALRVTRAGAIDVSSGVETAPGRKDPDLIQAFVAEARAISTEPAGAIS